VFILRQVTSSWVVDVGITERTRNGPLPATLVAASGPFRRHHAIK